MAKTEDILSPAILINDILRRMKYGGYSPIYQNIYTKLFSYSTLLLFFITWILQNIYLFTTNYEEFTILIMDLVIIGAVWQILTKSFAVHLKKKDILLLLDIIYNKFWTDDMLTKEERKKSQEIYKFTRIIIKVYTLSIYFTLFGHSATALLRGNHNLIMNPWLPGPLKDIFFTSPYFEILALLQFYLITMCTLSGLIPIDCLFVISIAVIIAQFRMLKSKLLSLGKEENVVYDSKLIIKCIDHHNLLFEAIATIEKIFSGLVLHIFGTNIMLSVVILLVWLTEDNITQLVELTSMFVSVFGQIYMYCLLGQLIQDETISVADAAYNCKWENIQDRNIKMSLLMTIQRSHKSARLTMGGMLILCLENFTRISRLMLSTLTLMLNMQNNK